MMVNETTIVSSFSTPFILNVECALRVYTKSESNQSSTATTLAISVPMNGSTEEINSFYFYEVRKQLFNIF